ncbi:MAG TPA: YqaA family protein [Xanthomonadaceae bacterium]|jgi:membrane protein YqaA with SNARE-associated domain
MKIFKPLYERALVWAASPRAPAILFALSVVEAIFFPVPPETMLAPMSLARPHRAFRYASISLLGSLLGAIAGYALGHFAYELIKPLLTEGMRQSIDLWVGNLRNDMHEHWLQMLGTLTVAALQPVIPMKFVTWAAGIVGVPMLPFLACITIGRGKRVYLLALAIRIGGERAEAALHRWIEPVGWISLVLLAVLGGWLAWRGMHG